MHYKSQVQLHYRGNLVKCFSIVVGVPQHRLPSPRKSHGIPMISISMQVSSRGIFRRSLDFAGREMSHTPKGGTSYRRSSGEHHHHHPSLFEQAWINPQQRVRPGCPVVVVNVLSMLGGFRGQFVPCHTNSSLVSFGLPGAFCAKILRSLTTTQLNSPSSTDWHDVMLCDNDDDKESVTNDNRLLANRLLPPQLIDSYLVETTHSAYHITMMTGISSQMMMMMMMRQGQDQIVAFNGGGGTSL